MLLAVARMTRPLVATLLASLVAACSGPKPDIPSEAEAASFAQSVAAIARRQARDDSIAAPGARSILLTHERTTPSAVVLLHGLTDSPRQFERLARLLFGDGDNVYVPRLPQHGLRGEDARALGALTAQQLRVAADSIVKEAGGLGRQITVIGLCMGGAVSAWIAQQEDVERAVLIAPAIEPGRVPAMLDRPLIGLADRLPRMTRRSPPDSARPDREVGFNTRAAAEVLELGSSVLALASRTAPRARSITVLVNANDRTVRETAAEQLARRWKQHGADVSVYELPDSLRLPHNIIDPIGTHIDPDIVLNLLRELAAGRDPPSGVVRPLPVR
jgi:esterase/lipase